MAPISCPQVNRHFNSCPRRFKYQTDMRLNVNVHGLHFVVPCGEGAQSFKWLGLAVAQRYALSAPHGRCRTREDAHIKPGFFIPACITKAHGGQVLLPSQRIVDVCKDNETVTVQLQQAVPVNEIGAPQLSAWAMSAFSTPTKSGTDVSTVKTAAVSLSSDAKATSGSTRSEPHGLSVARAESKSHENELKDYARCEMLQQVNSGQFQSELELEAAFLYDWSRLRVDELEKDPKERDAVQELLLAHFGPINAAYMHYAVGSGETGYGMSGHELAHFLHECGFYHVQQDAAAIEKLFAQCTRVDSFLSVFDRETLARVGFFHAMLRAMLYSPREASSGSTKESLEKKLKDRVIPTVARLTSGPFRDQTHHEKIVALFQEMKPKLAKLYAKYAQEHGEKSPKRDGSTEAAWPQLLRAAGLKSMLYDCGVFCVGDTRVHDEIFGQAMDQCFSGIREMRKFDDQEIVFAEFIEVLTRVGMTVLEENDLPPRDAIKITLDALRSLPVKSLRK